MRPCMAGGGRGALEGKKEKGYGATQERATAYLKGGMKGVSGGKVCLLEVDGARRVDFVIICGA